MGLLKKISNVSPAKVWDLLKNPWKIGFLRNRSVSHDLLAEEGILALFKDKELSPSEVTGTHLQLLKNSRFFEELENKMVEKRQHRTLWRNYYDFLYLVVRFTKPRVIFETGVYEGISSAVMLQAIKDNGDSGVLVSIDLPATSPIKWSTDTNLDSSLPPDCSPGWVVPDYLRDKYRLVFGDSKELLPGLIKEYQGNIDIFFHDSLHTFNHMTFEYNTIWPHLNQRGILVSDDILMNAAFYRFCNEKKMPYWSIEGMGVVLR